MYCSICHKDMTWRNMRIIKITEKRKQRGNYYLKDREYKKTKNKAVHADCVPEDMVGDVPMSVILGLV